MSYTATAIYVGLKFTSEGVTDHAAITAAMSALKACWDIGSHHAVLIVRFNGQIQYTTTAIKYEIDTR